MKRPAISTISAFAVATEAILLASASAPSRVANEPAWTAKSAPPAEAGARKVSGPRRRSTRPPDLRSQSPAGNATDVRSVARQTSSVVPGIAGKAGTNEGVGAAVGVADGVGVGGGGATGFGAGAQAATTRSRSDAADGEKRRNPRRGVTNPRAAA